MCGFFRPIERNSWRKKPHIGFFFFGTLSPSTEIATLMTRHGSATKGESEANLIAGRCQHYDNLSI